MKSFSKFISINCGGLLVLLIALGALACGGSRVQTPTPAAGIASPVSLAKPPSAAVVTPLPIQQAVATPPAASPNVPTAPAKTTADPNRGIAFGKPTVFQNGGLATVGVLVTNTSTLVKSFTVKATYKNGDQIAATALGAVNDLLPGQTRAAALLSTQAIPARVESVRLDVDTMIREAATTPGSVAASKLTFGPPAIQSRTGLSQVDVEVKNGGEALRGLTVQAAFVRGDELVGMAIGAVNDLAAGQTKTATLLVQGTAGSYDKILVSTDTIIG